ncbi:MAG: response regulator transcription factor [Oricola sp.]|jgi:two-component system, cell cycle response regulator CtrA|nr:response regulator transcription factor [Oricola sp.]
MRLFLFESNPTISDILIKNAKTARMEVDVLHDQEEALTLREKELENYAGILVGNMDDPFEVVDRLRLNGVKTPILMLSDVKNTTSALRAFSAGADDFLIKPVNPAELKMRVHAVSRRMNGRAETSFELGKLTVHLDGRDPEVDGERIKLSHREHAIFNFLSRNLGRVVPKESVYEAVYGSMECEPFEKVIDVYICKLRKKLAEASGGEHYIETVYCRGYKMDAPDKTVARRLGGANGRAKKVA